MDYVSQSLKFFNNRIFWIGFAAGMMGIFMSQLGVALPKKANPFYQGNAAVSKTILNGIK